MNIVNANDVIGVNVKNLENEDLGSIEAIMLDKITGKTAYVVLSYGGFLGMGDKLFALPWGIFSYDTSEDCFKVPVNEEKLKSSPGFNKENWPDMSNDTWRHSIDAYYGARN